MHARSLTPFDNVSFIVAVKSKLDWRFTGSIILLAISVLGFAYLFWETYAVAAR